MTLYTTDDFVHYVQGPYHILYLSMECCRIWLVSKLDTQDWTGHCVQSKSPDDISSLQCCFMPVRSHAIKIRCVSEKATYTSNICMTSVTNWEPNYTSKKPIIPMLISKNIMFNQSTPRCLLETAQATHGKRIYRKITPLIAFQGPKESRQA